MQLITQFLDGLSLRKVADEYEEESAGLDDLDAASDEEEEDRKEEQRKCGVQQHIVCYEFKCFKKMVWSGLENFYGE